MSLLFLWYYLSYYLLVLSLLTDLKNLSLYLFARTIFPQVSLRGTPAFPLTRNLDLVLPPLSLGQVLALSLGLSRFLLVSVVAIFTT